MEFRRIDHYSIRTLDLDASRRFYTEVMGFREGPRPPFDFPGYWLYNGVPPKKLEAGGNYGVVHLMGLAQGLRDYLGDRDEQSLKGKGTGPLDHVAFAATGRAQMVERLKRNKIEFFERDVPLLGLRQMFIKDPDGVTIELNYPASEATATVAAKRAAKAGAHPAKGKARAKARARATAR
jgi:catechol 2,3-dioxygenase-like lactoylglutathione lyase family enzyme